MMKYQIKVLKEHISVKRIQNTGYNEHKDSLRDEDLLVHVNFAENYRNDQQNKVRSPYLGHQSFSLFTSCCYYKGSGNTLQQKSIVVVTENSDHDRVASMNSLKRVVETVENKVGNMFSRLIVWSDGMSAQFRSTFVFKLSAGTLFPDKFMCWFYNERHHRKGPMDGVGGTLKNVIFRKVKSGQVVVYTPEEFANLVNEFVPSWNEYSINFLKTAADQLPFHTQWCSKAGGLICGHKVSIEDDNRCAECHQLYCENGSEWLECLVCKK